MHKPITECWWIYDDFLKTHKFCSLFYLLCVLPALVWVSPNRTFSLEGII